MFSGRLGQWSGSHQIPMMSYLHALVLSDEMVKFMEEVKSLGYTDKPNYQKFRSILQGGFESIGASDDGKLDFTSVDVKPSRTAVKVSSPHYWKGVACVLQMGLLCRFLSCHLEKVLPFPADVL